MKKTILYLLLMMGLMVAGAPTAQAQAPSPTDAPSVVVNRYFELCDGDVFYYRGIQIDQPGVYNDTLFAQDGTDSIFVMVVNRAPSYRFEEEINLGDNQVYEWHGQTISQTGTYYDEHRTVSGCDSTYVLHAAVYPTYQYVEERVVCENELPYRWKGEECSHAGSYTRAYKSVHGLDSIYTLTLRVLPISRRTEYRELCHGSVLELRGRVITEAGQYIDTLKAANGCDSIITTIVNYANSYYHEQFASLSEGGSYRWHGRDLTEAGVYWDSAFTTQGCDSIYKLELTTKQAYEYMENIAICENELPYIFRGRELYGEGRYSDRFFTHDGVDSIYTIELSVRPIHYEERTIDLCEGDSVTLHGRKYGQAAIVVDTVQTAEGCYDIIRYTIVVHPTYLIENEGSIKDGGTYSWHGETYTTPGVYYDRQHTTFGCDSVYRLTLYRQQDYYFEDSISVCKSELPYVWRGQHIYEANTYYDRLSTRLGGDSIYCLKVSVLPTAFTRLHEEFCQSDGFYLNGIRYDESTIVYDTLISAMGCDSVVMHILNAHQTYLSDSEGYLHKNGSYTWRGNDYTKPGVYYDSLQTTLGCDSIFRLTLHENPSYYHRDSMVICENELPYVWRGKELYSSKVYYDSLFTEVGTDSIYVLALHVLPTEYEYQTITICQGEEFQYKGQDRSRQGIYTDTLLTDSGCMRILQMQVNVLPTYHFEETQYLENGSYTWHGTTYDRPGIYEYSDTTVLGCDSTFRLTLLEKVEFHFVINDTICHGDLPYTWEGKTITEGGVYHASYENQQGGDSVYTLNLVVKETSYSTMYVNLCHGDTYLFGDQIITQPGVYRDTLVARNGCDSILTLIANELPSYAFEKHITLPPGGEYEWYGQMYKKPGTYHKYYQSVDGCDSVISLTIHDKEVYYIDSMVTICQNEAPYIFRGKQYFHTGEFFDSIATTVTTDTVARLHLTVLPTYLKEMSIDLCEGQHYTFRGKDLSEPGIYYDSLYTHNGCDSIYRIVVNRLPSYRYFESHVMASNETYLWHGQTITESGTYYDRRDAENGCDSIYTLEVTVVPTYHYEETATVCQSELPYHYMGQDYDLSGTYERFYHTTQGYDSIYTLHLNVLPTYHYTSYLELCEGETFDFRGQLITKAGVYHDTLNTHAGCDSIYTLVVNRATSYITSRYVELCEGDTYPFGGEDITEPGVYLDTLRTINGCDSIVKLVVNRATSYKFSDYHELCEGETFIFRGRTITDPGVYADTLLTRAGCDSIYQMVVNRAASYRFIDSIELADNHSITWHGQTVDRTSTYIDAHQTTSGCDSTYVLHAVVYPTYDFVEKHTVCESELPFSWQGSQYTHEGVYTRAFLTINGYDSIYTLQLHVLPVSHSTIHIDLCEGHDVTLNGRQITKAGTYRDTLVAANGCDSIVDVVVNLSKSFHIVETINIPDNGSATWRGNTYTKAGTYYERHETQSGCDSIYELNLHVYPTYNFRSERTVCESELPYTSESGVVYTHAGEYSNTYKTINGFDSIETFVLHVQPSYHVSEQYTICRGNVLTVRGRMITEPGIYADTLRTINGCDSIISMVVNAAQSYYLEQYAQLSEGGSYRWGDRILTEAGVYWDSTITAQGCDSIHKLVLTYKKVYEFTDSVAICDNELPYLWHGEEYYNSGRYYDSLYTIGGMDSVHVLILNVLPSSYHEQELVFCEGDDILFRDHHYTESVVLFDTMQTANGCYDITKYVLNRQPSYRIEREAYINRGGTYYWHKDAYQDRPERIDTLIHDGVYYDSLKTVHGCDSVFKLTLRYNPTYHFEQKETICEQDLPYLWRGKSLYKTNVYHDTLKTVAGVDSIYSLDLTVYHSYHIDHLVELCQGETYTYKNHTFTEAGTYYDSLLTVHGCDSVIQVTVNYHPAYTVEQEAFFCDETEYVWRNHINPLTNHEYVFDKPGTYYDRQQTVFGCDSTIILYLKRAPKFLQTIKDTVCESELPYIWHGKEYTKTGIYDDSNVSIYGCDSTYILDLLVVPSYLEDMKIRICRGDIYDLNGTAITKAGIYYDSLYTVDGCDSVIRYSVNYLRTHELKTDKAICEGDVYQWRGRDLILPGVYHDSLQTIDGCDSIFTLNLTVNPLFDEHLYDTICSSELPYTWLDQRIEEAGDYEKILRSSLGCDSTYHLHLTVNPSYEFVDHLEACEGETIIFRGDTLTSSKVYTDTLFTTQGCDSVRRLVVNFTPSYIFHESVTRCSDDYYEWHGQTLHAPGLYYDRYTTVSTGCDSIYIMDYKVDSAYKFVDDIIVCRDSLPFIWRGREFYVDTTCVDTFLTQVGCDSTYTLNLTILPECAPVDSIMMCPGSSVWVHNKEYTRPGQYVHYLATEHSGNRPDSIYRFQIVTAPTYYHRDSVVLCENELPYYYNDEWYYEAGVYIDTLSTIYGCDSVFELHLGTRSAAYQELSVEICEGEHFFFRGKEYDTPGVFYDTMYTVGGCDSVFHIVLNRAASYMFTERQTINEGGSYLFHRDGQNRWLTQPGVYWDSCRTVSGCDSIYRLELVVNKTYHFIEEKDFCADSDSLPYVWHGKTLYEGGIYFDRQSTYTGQDSIYELRLTIHQIPMTTIERTYCENDFVTIGDQYITENGIYYHTYQTKWGCDSIVKYVLNFKPAYRVVRKVSIVEGDYYIFPGNDTGNDTVRTAGTYYQRLKSVNECDSTFELQLTVGHNYRIERDVTLCYSELPFVDPIDGKMYYQSGSYTHYLKTQDGLFDSIHVYNVTVLPEVPVTIVNTYLCEGDMLDLYIGGRVIKDAKDGEIYEDTLHNSFGCDSIVRHIIHKAQKYHIVEEVKLREGNVYTWPNHWGTDGNLRTFDRTGSYFDSLQTHYGCDSIYELRVVVGHDYYIERDTTICYEDLPYVDPIDGTKYNESCTYEHLYKTILGFDSIIAYKVNVLPKVPITIVNNYLCEGDVLYLSIGGVTKVIKEGGDYFDTLHTVLGCDSVIRHVVHQQQTYHYVEDTAMCEIDTYTWNNHWDENGNLYVFTKSGTYFDVVPGPGDCNTTYELHLRLRDSYSKDTTVLICRDELVDRPRDFRGDLLDFSQGDRIDMIDEQIASTGCDSITRYTYLLTDNCPDLVEKHLCDNEIPFVMNGETIWKEGVYRFPTWDVRDVVDPVTGQTHKEVHYDRVDRIVVKIHPTESYSETITVCHDIPYIWHGQTLTRPGTYYDYDTTAFGCEIKYELILNHYPVTPDVVDGLLGTIPDYGNIYWPTVSRTIYGSSLVADELNELVEYATDANGCTFQYKASVYVVKTKYETHNIEICETDLPYTYSPQQPAATAAGTYDDVIWDPTARRSEIHTYVIVVDRPSTNVTLAAGDVCQDSRFGTTLASTFSVTVGYLGGDPTNYRVTFSSAARNQGFVDQEGIFNVNTKTIELEVPAGTQPDPYGNPMNFVRPGEYEFSVELINGQCGLFSTATGTFEVQYPSWFIEQHFSSDQGAVGLLSPSYNGGHSFLAYRWYINGVLQSDATPYLYRGNWKKGDLVYAVLTEGNGTPIATCPIVINCGSAPGGRPVFRVASRTRGVIKAAGDGQYRIVGVNGLLFSQGRFRSGETEIPMPPISGYYVLEMKEANGAIVTEKIVLY